VNWTQTREESEYRKVIEATKELVNAEGLSASEWELNYYNRRV